MRYLVSILFFFASIQCVVAETSDTSAPSRIDAAEEARAEYEARVASWRGAAPKAAEKSEPEAAQPVSRMFQGLFACLAVLVGGSWIYRRYVVKEPLGTTRRLKIIERLPLGAKGALCLVEVEGRTVLVGMGAETFSFMELSKGEFHEQTEIEGGVWNESEERLSA